MFIMLKRRNFVQDFTEVLILNSCKALSEWSLFFSDDLVMFSHFKVSSIDPELRPGSEFPKGG